MKGLDSLARMFLYYPGLLPADMPPPGWAGSAEEVWLQCEDGVRIHGLWWPEPEGAPVILFLHGNAQEVYSWSMVHEELAPLGCRLLLIDYHGYGKSGGEPHEAGLYLDGRAALQWLHDRDIGDGGIIVFGKSLGGAVACELAREREFKALVLESTFTSLARVARKLFPFFPPGIPIGEKYDSISKIAGTLSPVLVIHGQLDELIPVGEGLDLFEAAPDPKQLYLVPGAGHNNVSMVAGPAYTKRISTFLQ